MERELNEKWALVVGAVTMHKYNYSEKNYQCSRVPLLLALQILLSTSLAPSIYN